MGKRLVEAFFIFWVMGIGGLALDLDHVIVLLARGMPLTLANLATQAGRPAHIPALALGGIMCVVFGALFARWIVMVRRADYDHKSG